MGAMDSRYPFPHKKIPPALVGGILILMIYLVMTSVPMKPRSASGIVTEPSAF